MQPAHVIKPLVYPITCLQGFPLKIVHCVNLAKLAGSVSQNPLACMVPVRAGHQGNLLEIGKGRGKAAATLHLGGGCHMGPLAHADLMAHTDSGLCSWFQCFHALCCSPTLDPMSFPDSTAASPTATSGPHWMQRQQPAIGTASSQLCKVQSSLSQTS